MNRCRFLAYFGLIPIASAAPVLALPQPDKAKEHVRSTIRAGQAGKPLIYEDGKLIIDMARVEKINLCRDVHERIEGDRIIREGGERRLTVTF